ncbi:MAG: uracil-DNA glycosylase [Chloroflexi bacterium]|nr:uracil-DNA glycosylase [Chloroflexota bacterium]
MAAIAAEVRRCTRCSLAQTRTNAVPGEGTSSPTVMFIGEGPGFNEDQQGRPFVGRAGQLLDELLASVPLRREDVFITNVVKCRPPENREPAPEEISACAPFLEAQIELLRPRVIATLGRHSLARFVPEARISTEHGRILRWRGFVLLPLYHPAAALRSTAVLSALEADIRRLPEAVLESLALRSDPAERASQTPATELRQAASRTRDTVPEMPVGGDTAASRSPDSQGQLSLF